MSNATLIGDNKVTESEVISVPAVPFTRTFRPVHHREVINAIRTGITAVGLEVVRTEYVLAGGGNKMFGVWDLGNTGNNDLCWSMGVRNSMDKSMALGITAGTRVFVCQNMAFDGEFVELRRHTKGLTLEELEFMAYRAIRCLVGKLTKFQAWHEGLRRFSLDERSAKLLLIELMTQSVIPVTKFPMFQDLYFGGVYDQTLWGFHGATTHILKEANLLTLPKKNRILNAILNQHIEGMQAELPSTMGEFYQQRAIVNRRW